MAFQFLAPALKLAGGVALVNTVNDLLQLPNIKIGTNNPETDVGKILGDRLFNNFNNYMRGRTGSSGNAGGAQSIDPSGSGYIEPLGSYGYDELRKQWALAPRPIVQSSIPIATPVIEGDGEEGDRKSVV